MSRKLLRDLSGVSAFRILRPRFKRLNEFRHLRLTISFLSGQLTIAALFWFFSNLTMYLCLWILPWACVYQILNRVRAISEHGGMTQSPDRRKTTHYVRQNRLANFFLVPFNVGYHLAHHVDMLVPYRNLPLLNEALIEDGYISSDRIWPSYRSLWKALVTKNKLSGVFHFQIHHATLFNSNDSLFLDQTPQSFRKSTCLGSYFFFISRAL